MSRSRCASACRAAKRLGDHALLVRRRLGHGSFAQRIGAPDRRVALGFGRGDLGVALDARHVGPAHVGDVLVLVADLLDGERDHFEPHLAHVVRAGGAHPLAHHLRLLHDLLDGELADDAAQMAFHHQADQAFALRRSLGEELLGGGEDRLLVGAHLDLRDGFDRYRDALLGVEILLRSDIEAHQLERELAAVLHHRKDHGAVPLDDARAAEAVDNHGLVRAGLAIHPGQHAHQENQRQYSESDKENDLVRHCVPDPFHRESEWLMV